MKKLICLTSLAFVVCCATHAQQRPGTLPGTPGHPAGNRPVIHFSAMVREADRSVWLQWDADSVEEGNYFIVERGKEDSHYETIGALRSTGIRGHYELTDQAAPNGSDFYRIKYTGQKDSSFYSRTLELTVTGALDFRFYPNPVDEVCIMRAEHSIDLQIIDPAGNIRISKRLQPGIQVINVASLEHGVYILRVTDKESNRAVSQQLVKN